MKNLDDIMDECSVRGGAMPTKGVLGRRMPNDPRETPVDQVPLTGGGGYDASGDHVDSYNGALCPFTESDWMAYSGCEDEKPFIGAMRTRHEGRDEWTGDVIVDGKTVCVFLFCGPDYAMDYWFCKEFNRPEMAVFVANAILKGPNPDRQWGMMKSMLENHSYGAVEDMPAVMR